MSFTKVKNQVSHLLHNPYFWALLLGVVSLHLARECALLRRSAPPPLVKVGQWSLTDQQNKKFGSKELAGKVYIAHFFFTSCPTICPKLTKDMILVAKQFEKLKEKIEFVSISVDPETDTPEALSSYMRKNNIVQTNWHFLTGTTPQVYDVVVGQMKLHMGDKEEFKKEASSEVLYNISHVAEIALFDQNGDLRGKFPTTPTSLAALERAAKFLIEKGA